MDKITFIINAAKRIETKTLKQKIDQLEASERVEVLIVSYHNKFQSDVADYLIFAVDDHDDVSFSQLLKETPTDRFLFFNPEIAYPSNFLTQILSVEEKAASREKENIWKESIIAVQQSNYGLFAQNVKSNESFSLLKESVLYIKEEVESLNTDKMSVYPELSVELYRYADRKKLNLTFYEPKREKVKYITNFAELMFVYQKQAQNQFKFFPALFVLFFLVFGIGASFHPVFLLIFLIGMSGYMLMITLEAFGLATIKKNGALLPILLFMFPFVHLVYGLESWMAKFKKKA